MESSHIVEIKFKGERRGLFKTPKDFFVKVGDYVIVQAERGVDLGRVNHLNPFVSEDTEVDKLRKVLRKPSRDDLQRFQENRHQEELALKKCKQKVKNHALNMKLIDCEFQFDCNKITFYFTSENRVDFRKLVRDVAAVYRTRIEFRQIGVRDEARRLGGYGVCGRELCCSCWIRDFLPVTTQAAKDQNLPLNPSKLAGVCGRLKCCLMFERDFYNRAIKRFPQLARPITTERGEGIVSNIDIFNDEVIVLYPDDSTETYSLEFLQDRLNNCEHNCGHANPAEGNLN
ncbi:MAG: hypothetical protein D6743_15270 [Calditrichaeota bacterium]|nr:MAG: hypothetical protein D6743_15270 [Calditrichota bacterium]